MEHYNTTIGHRQVWGGTEPFGLSRTERRQHLYAIGKTGTGKSTLLQNLIVGDILRGEGVALLDRHGDLSENTLNLIPPSRMDDVVYFNPADTEFPVGLNLLGTSQSPSLVASGVVEAFKSIWRDSWGPRLEYILHACVSALSECQNVSLLGIQRMLSDKRYRQWVVGQVKDPWVRSFFEREFSAYSPGFLQEAIAPIQNKVGQLFMSPISRNILGQVQSKIDVRFMMDNRRILIANLSKGRLGEDQSNLLGALLVASFSLAAMGRADIPEEERTDFSLYVDEFQNFTSDSFGSILSEARKYRLSLTLSHQYMGQLKKETLDAVLGNVGSILSFRVGEADADVLEKEFGGEYSRASFTELGNYEVCAKLIEGGNYARPFMGKTMPPLGTWYGRKEAMIRRSREKYSTPRSVVEGKLQRWIK